MSDEDHCMRAYYEEKLMSWWVTRKCVICMVVVMITILVLTASKGSSTFEFYFGEYFQFIRILVKHCGLNRKNTNKEDCRAKCESEQNTLFSPVWSSLDPIWSMFNLVKCKNGTFGPCWYIFPPILSLWPHFPPSQMPEYHNEYYPG